MTEQEQKDALEDFNRNDFKADNSYSKPWIDCPDFCISPQTLETIRTALSQEKVEVVTVEDITPEMHEDLAKTFHPQMEGQSVQYLWKHFYTVLGKHGLKIVDGGEG